jgi:hypothetical protein
MKSSTMYVVLGVAVVLVSLAVLSMFGAKHPTPTTPVATSTIATSTTASTAANGMQVYRNEQYKFMFEYATNTKIEEEVNESKIYYDYFLTSVGVSGNKERIVGISPNISAIEDRMHQLMGEPSYRQIFVLQPGQKATKKVLGNTFGTTEIQVTGEKLLNTYGVTEVQASDADKKICELYTIAPSKSYYLVIDCRYKSILDSLTFF